MSPCEVLWVQNRPAVVARWLMYPSGNFGVLGSASLGGGGVETKRDKKPLLVGILFVQIPPFWPVKWPTGV